MSWHPAYVVVSPGGAGLFSSPDPREALAYAERLGPTQWLAPTEGLAARRAANPDPGDVVRRLPTASQMAKTVRRASVPPMTMREVMTVGLTEADLVQLDPAEQAAKSLEHARKTVLPIFVMADRAARAASAKARHRDPDDEQGVGLDLSSWTTPAKGWLGVNAKLAKTKKGVKAMALGLSLLPESSVFKLRSEAGTVLTRVQAPRPATWGPEGEDAPDDPTLCSFASMDCKRSCLVNTGQNAAGYRANYTKYAKARALLEHPLEFMRILCEALRRYEGLVPKGMTKQGARKLVRFVRLNIFSDIPWEEVVPWVFDAFPGLYFYDYTKVPGRLFGDPHLTRRDALGLRRYDLSFSYSGRNEGYLVAEFDRGRRAVYVYVAAQYVRSQRVSGILTKKLLGKKATDLLLTRLRQEVTGKIKDKTRKIPKEKRRSKDDPVLGATSELDSEYDKLAAAVWRHVNRIPEFDDVPGVGRVEVVDGDESDFRAFDKDDVIVGLRWKSPKVWVPASKAREELPFSEIPAKPWREGETNLPKSFVLLGEVNKSGDFFRFAQTPSGSTQDVLPGDWEKVTAKQAIIEAFGLALEKRGRLVPRFEVLRGRAGPTR